MKRVTMFEIAAKLTEITGNHVGVEDLNAQIIAEAIRAGKISWGEGGKFFAALKEADRIWENAGNIPVAKSLW